MKLWILQKKICNQPSLEMVERHGEQPKSIYCENMDGEIASMAALIKQFEEGENASLGIIVKTEAEAKRFYDLLSKEHPVHLLSQDSTRFTNGVSITSIRMAKGLEFDEVIVPDVDNRNYAKREQRSQGRPIRKSRRIRQKSLAIYQIQQLKMGSYTTHAYIWETIHSLMERE